MIIPVLDLKKGEAVSGKSGMRETYKPLRTVFHDSSNPLAIASALKDSGYKRIYVADLDAIAGTGTNLDLVRQMNQIIPVMLDSGVNDVESAKKILDNVEKVIIATETLKSLEDLYEIFSKSLKKDLIMSVDVKDGCIHGKHITADFHDILEKIGQIKPVEVILLDISRVGTGRGVDHQLIGSFQGLETKLIIGGGVTNKDIIELNELGVQNFLVGTALHAGIFQHHI